MIIEPKLGVDRCMTSLMLQPQPYDAHPPVESINYQCRMRLFDPNICAVSAAITMQGYAAESLTLHEPVQAHVVEAIERFFVHRRFKVNPVEWVPATIPTGDRRALISANGTPLPDDTVFALGDSGAFSSIATVHSIRLASNVACFLPDTALGRLVATLASVVFVAPDYVFEEIAIGDEEFELLGQDEFRRYQRLINSVNIKLTRESGR